MLRQFTFLGLIVVGLALLILEPHANSITKLPSNTFRVSEHHMACSRTVSGPTLSRASVIATVRAHELRCLVSEFQAGVRASIARFQAKKECLLNSLTQKLTGKRCAVSSPAWRDVHYDAQALVELFGLCKRIPV